MKQRVEPSSALKLYKATRFWARLWGLHAYPRLSWHVGLYIAPCNAIHTCGLSYAIDVVFLDAHYQVIGQRSHMPPWRLAVCWKATAVIELPAGYCRACPDYQAAILAALASG